MWKHNNARQLLNNDWSPKSLHPLINFPLFWWEISIAKLHWITTRVQCCVISANGHFFDHNLFCFRKEVHCKLWKHVFFSFWGKTFGGRTSNSWCAISAPDSKTLFCIYTIKLVKCCPCYSATTIINSKWALLPMVVLFIHRHPLPYSPKKKSA